LALLPLALLPSLGWLPARSQTPARAAIVVIALLAWAWTATRPFARPSGIALLATSPGRRRLGVWELCLLAVVAAITVAYIVAAARITEISTNDGAYYYGVARHMVRSGRFEEPIVWHFLKPPEHIVHAPFDYWGPMTSLVLAPALALFGAAPTTAFLTMSAIGAGTVLAFWYLICVALPLRYCAVQLVALLLFAFSPAMDRYRFQPESTGVAHLFLLLSLIAFCRKRLALALLCAFGILLTRADGAILFALIFLAVLGEAWWSGADSKRRVLALAAIGCACVGIYALWNLVSFGTPTPPAAQTLPFLRRYAQVYDFGPSSGQSVNRLPRWISPGYALARIGLAVRTLRAIPFTPVLDWWLALIVVGALGLCRCPAGPRTLIWVLCVVGYLLVVVVSGPGFAAVRAPHTFTPLVVLAGAVGADALLARLHVWMKPVRRRRVKAVAIGAAVFAACAFVLARLPALRTRQALTAAWNQAQLPKLDAVLQGEPVASNRPWFVIAYTDSPAVSIPSNGEAAIEAVLARYQVRWLVLFGAHGAWGARRSSATLNRVTSADRSVLGRFQLERVPVDGVSVVLYRVRP
jgi:hypothetical protein